MKATGEVMSVGRTVEESLLKAARSLEIGVNHLYMKKFESFSDDPENVKLYKRRHRRPNLRGSRAFAQKDRYRYDLQRHKIDMLSLKR